MRAVSEIMHGKPREIFLTNTQTGRRERLETLEPGKIRFYSCGPTVYGFIHVGNLRAALVSDLFYRWFKRAGYAVNFVRNYTDVDDKIIKRAAEEGISPEELARKYIREVEKDYAVAGLEEPTHKTRVTDHIPEIIALIGKILANGKGYVTPSGEVLFSIEAFPEYGKLSHRNLEDNEAGARVEVRDEKRSPHDFSLWKPAKPGEPSWDSPWGKGRPGWHIECSAMASKWLGQQMDVHHGGEDLVFPHHENEIAQSEAASGQAPYVRVWVHNAFLNINQEKMSKSLGNFITARDFLTRFGGEVARYLLLSAHYRSLIDFGDEAVENALTSLERLYEAKQKAVQLQGLRAAVPDLRAEAAWGQFAAQCQDARRAIDDAFAQDLNVPGALGAVFTLIRDFNRTLGEPLAQATPSAILGAGEFIRVLEDSLGGLLGIGRSEPGQALERFREIRAQLPGKGGLAKPTADEIAEQIRLRAEARAARDFAEADRIRKDLDARGVVIKDSPAGTTWQYK